MDMRRRQTLGVLNSNTTAASRALSRKSMGMKRQSSIGVRKTSTSRRQSSRSRFSLAPSTARPSMGRKSLAGRPSMGGRRQSVYAGAGGKSSIRDPRPIGDKRFQAENIRTLITFLTSHNYEQPLSPKLLTAPSTRDFKSILTFLFSLVDPLWADSVDPKNFEQEAVAMMAMLGFPFSITKSSLKSPGSPHTWPTMLASLVWVIEFISYHEVVEDMESKQLDEEAGLTNAEENSEKLFFDFLSRAYMDFMQGTDDGDTVHAELKQQFDARNEGVNNAIAGLSMENDRLEKELRGLKATENELAQLKGKRTDLKMDAEKFEAYNQKLEQHLQAVQTKANEVESELENVEQELLQSQLESETLQQTIRDQPISPQEVQRMTRERTMLEQRQGSLSEQKQNLQQSCWDLEMKISKRNEDVKAGVSKFNELARQASLIPKHGKNAGGVDFKLRFNGAATDPLDMITPHLKVTVKPKLVAIEQDFQDRVRVAQEELRDMCDKLETLEGLGSEKKERVQEVNASLKKIQDAFTATRDAMKTELNGILAEVEETELNMVKLKKDHKEALKASQAELQEIDFEETQQQEAHEQEIKHLKQEVDGLLDRLTKSKLAVSSAISEMEATAANVESSIQQQTEQ